MISTAIDQSEALALVWLGVFLLKAQVRLLNCLLHLMLVVRVGGLVEGGSGTGASRRARPFDVGERLSLVVVVALLHLLDPTFAVQATADHFICRHELIKLLLQVVILPSKHVCMALESK